MPMNSLVALSFLSLFLYCNQHIKFFFSVIQATLTYLEMKKMKKRFRNSFEFIAPNLK